MWHLEQALGLVTLPGPMHITGSTVVTVRVRNSCVTVPKRVTKAWEQSGPCQHAERRGEERALRALTHQPTGIREEPEQGRNARGRP